MQLGVVFPQLDIGADPAGVRAYAQAVQGMGYQHLLAYDHVVGADVAAYPGWSGPYNHESLFHEPFVLFGFLAAAVPELELVTGVIILPQRQTVLVAKQAAEVDVLTNGRFRLGVGLGWNHVEYEALGAEFRTRGRRFEEQLDLLRRLWKDPVVSYEGRWHRVTAAGLNPLPVRRSIPLWIGASSEVAIRRAARMADGFFPMRPLEGGWPATLDRMRAWREEAGLSWEGYGIEARVHAGSGAPDEWRREADEWRALGATHLSVNTMRGEIGSPDGHIRRLQEVYAAITK